MSTGLGVDGADPSSAGARRRPELIILRLLPGSSPLHRLWAGTKLLIVMVLAILVAVQPTWTTLLAIAVVVGVGLLVARVPLGAFPRLPRWFWLVFALGGLLTLRSGTAPVERVAGLDLSIGGLGQWALLATLGIVLVVAALLLAWTTPLGEVAPAIGRLTAPLRCLRLPVDEWVVAVGLSIRCFPLLLDELRTLVAVRRLRRRPSPRPRVSFRRAFANNLREAHDLLSTAIVVALRRAGDFAEAIEARGGVAATLGRYSGPRLVDGLVLAAVVAIAVSTLLV
ncbi:MAG TPA: energy-coupling factor transporter transmembrane protein EcfT [Acidimicrobiia bacterium]|nr:energy-coupling factor transporter transmembrane protein EcfT [Acidimicrobiia bacterium]